MLPAICIYIIVFLCGIVIGTFLKKVIYCIFLKENKVTIGRCPVVEMLNGILYLVILHRYGMNTDFLIYCLLFSALLTLSVIDFRTYEIPVGINVFILMLGLIRILTDWSNWKDYLIGFLVVSIFLYAIYIVTCGQGIGGGDVKLMAVCGLVLGWKRIVLGFLLGCIIGSVCHLIRMRLSDADHVLAMGPYLSVGIMIATLWGNQMIDWYIALCLGM